MGAAPSISRSITASGPLTGQRPDGKLLVRMRDESDRWSKPEATAATVRPGAHDCLVRLAYAPNHIEPIDIFYEMSGRGERQSPEFFSHPKMAARYPATVIGAALAQGRHFLDAELPWNG